MGKLFRIKTGPHFYESESFFFDQLLDYVGNTTVSARA